MRRIKLSGREMSLIRAIGFGIGATGEELLAVTSYDPPDLTDMLNGMMNAGFIITEPYLIEISEEALTAVKFEVNGAYSHELKKSMAKRF